MGRSLPDVATMFTGLIQDIGTVAALARKGQNVNLIIESDKLAPEIGIGDSVAISGVCLTATAIEPEAGRFHVTAVSETILRTRLRSLKQGDKVNLELSLRPSDRLGGHFVQGHVDIIGKCIAVEPAEGSWVLTFSYPSEYAELLTEKGSIAIDGVSLTAYERSDRTFRVSVVPHTWAATTLSTLKPGDPVNLEFDLIGKYILNYKEQSGKKGLTMDKLIELGY